MMILVRFRRPNHGVGGGKQNTLLSSRLRNPRPLQKRCTPNTQGTSSPLDISSSRLHRAYNRCIILIGISFQLSNHLLAIGGSHPPTFPSTILRTSPGIIRRYSPSCSSARSRSGLLVLSHAKLAGTLKTSVNTRV